MKRSIKNVYEQIEEETYVSGFGFISPNPKAQMSSKIKKYSNIFSLAIISFFIMNNILLYPFTLVLDMIGLQISSNSSGIITASELIQYFAQAITNIFAFIVVVSLVYFFDRKFYHDENIFKKIDSTMLTTAIIITLAFWTIANVIAVILDDIFKIVGIVNLPAFEALYIIDKVAQFGILTSLVMTILQEILFRGIILFRLNKFGEYFAIIATSLLFALYSAETLLAVKWFIVSIPLCYFTLKSKNVLVAVIARLCCTYGLSTLQIIFGTSVHASSIIIVTCVTILVLGLLTFFKMDIVLDKDTCIMNNNEKILLFITSPAFVVLFFTAIVTAQGVLQFIG